MQGKIISSICGTFTVSSNSESYELSAKGAFRNLHIKPIVGDNVIFDEKTAQINEILSRINYLKRPEIANIDQILIVMSLCKPDFSYHLIFKYLTYANMNNIPARIVITKKDLSNSDTQISEIKEVLSKMQIPFYFVNNKNLDGIDVVKEICANKVSALMGQTGSGKSSLLNAIDPTYQRKIGEYSLVLHRGKHQTKETILLPFANGYLADTPGFSSLDLNIFKEDLAKYFPMFSSLYTKCYFSNCLHVTESKCAVKEELEKNNIPHIAYETYVKLLEESPYQKEKKY